MSLSQDDLDRMVAAVGLVGRAGAKGFQVGFLHDGVPSAEADWYAHAQYRGARIIEEHHVGPVEAAEALAERLLTGAICRCGHMVGLASSLLAGLPGDLDVPRGARTTPFGVGLSEADVEARLPACRWRRVGREWVPGCVGPSIDMREGLPPAPGQPSPQPSNRERRRGQ